MNHSRRPSETKAAVAVLGPEVPASAILAVQAMAVGTPAEAEIPMPVIRVVAEIPVEAIRVAAEIPVEAIRVAAETPEAAEQAAEGAEIPAEAAAQAAKEEEEGMMEAVAQVVAARAAVKVVMADKRLHALPVQKLFVHHHQKFTIGRR